MQVFGSLKEMLAYLRGNDKESSLKAVEPKKKTSTKKSPKKAKK